MENCRIPGLDILKKKSLLLVALALLLTTTHIWFKNDPPLFKNPNITSNFCGVMAIVDFRTFQIDKCLSALYDTEDKSFYKGHYYSDKAFGYHVLLVPLAQALRHTFLFYPNYQELLYFLRIFGLSIPTVLFWLLTFSFWEKLSGSPAKACVLVLAGSLGTNFFIYATRLFVHVPATILFFCSYLWIREMRHAKLKHWECFWAGFLLAYSLITDFLLFWAAIIMFFYGMFSLRFQARHSGLFLLGICLPLLFFCWINFRLFDHPLHPAYFFYQKTAVARQYRTEFLQWDFIKSFKVFWAAWFSASRGMFYFSPFLILGPIGYLRLWKDREFARDAILCPLIVAGNFLMISKAATFDGGWAAAMRYLVPSVPFLLIGVGGWLRYEICGSAGKVMLKAFILVSVLVTALVTITFSDYPEIFSDPVLQVALPMLQQGLFGETIVHFQNAGIFLFCVLMVAVCAGIFVFDFFANERAFSMTKSVLLPLLLAAMILNLYFQGNALSLDSDICAEQIKRYNEIVSWMGRN